VRDLLWQSVDAQVKTMSQWEDQEAGEEASLRLLTACWQAEPANEDAFRALAEKLGKRERFQQVEEYYTQLCIALEREGREPHERTEKVMEFARTKAILRKQALKEGRTREMSHASSAFLTYRHDDLPTPLANPLNSANLDGMQEQLLQRFISPEFGLPTRFANQDKTLYETLQEFAALTDLCRRLSEGSELQTAERILWAYLPRIEAFVTSSSLKEPERAARLIAEGYLLAASLVGHRNDLYRRQKYSEQALFYGEIAQDATLQVAAIRQIATTFNYQERFQQVLETYQRALPLLADVSPLLRSCIYAALSGVYAQFQRKDEADRAIGVAYEHFGEHQGEEPDLLRSINASENLLIQWAGENHLKLGRPRQAEAVLSKLNVMDPQLKLPKRIRIEAINARVQMFLAIDQMEQACSYLETALQLAIEVGSSLRLREVTQTLHLLRKQWPEEKPVRQLSDLLVELLINHPK
jgi:tetratricopeptide (TPR) repeat protein